MKIQAKDNKAPLPYMFDFYNVTAFHEMALSQNRNVLSCSFNSFMKGMTMHTDYPEKNLQPHLPRMIIIIPDWDLLCFINHFSFGVTMFSRKCPDWLLNNIEKVIESRKDLLRHRKSGFVAANEPKIIWVKMINHSNQQRILAVQNKFNNALEELLLKHRYHSIMDVGKDIADGHNFTYNNILNTWAQIEYWNAVNQLIERFDYYKESLRPGEKEQPPANNTMQPMPHSSHSHTDANYQHQPINSVAPRITIYPKNSKYYQTLPSCFRCNKPCNSTAYQLFIQTPVNYPCIIVSLLTFFISPFTGELFLLHSSVS